MSNAQENIFVVGIASSAGGLTPLLELIENAICHSHMAFILVPHLSRNYESELPEILKRVSNLTILTITNGMIIKPCHLYVLPPGHYAFIEKKQIKLKVRPTGGVNQSANILFESLAQEYKTNAIGVVLSGAAAGSDGSEGVLAIKNGGGHTFAQAPSSATFPQMPELAIRTGSIDSVLNAQDIGRELSLMSWYDV